MIGNRMSAGDSSGGFSGDSGGASTPEIDNERWKKLGDAFTSIGDDFSNTQYGVPKYDASANDQIMAQSLQNLDEQGRRRQMMMNALGRITSGR
jgi:hypothetical protein